MLDVDPYGSPWPTLDAFFASARPCPARLDVVVNDGLRVKSKRGGLWTMDSMADVVDRYGDGCYEHYLEICQGLLKKMAAQAGYRLSRWAGYYTGHNQQMTHYWAVLEQR